VVRATGYQPNQAATLNVISAVGSTIGTASVTASADGLISASWIVLSDAPIGDCTIRITADGIQKSIQDLQTFTVVGYTIKVQTTNLAGQVVPEVALHAIDS
jgi:uncharacterized protein YfaS (alpha-2-macroglobulin family)